MDINIISGLKKGTFTFLILALLFSACSKKTGIFTDAQGKNYNTGQVYDSLVALANTQINYAIYFPKSYDGTKNFPVLFLLDPHANGVLPVKKYQQLADKYGYIVVGSNNSQNGLAAETSLLYVQGLIEDVKSRFVFDQERMFIGGFSGGAKLAIIFADKVPGLIGAVACGGSVPMALQQQPAFYFAGIVGDCDFNYLEMRQTYSMFDKFGFDYTAEVFHGKHEWPPVASFEMALIGFDIYSAKIKKKELSDNYLANVTIRINDSAAFYNQQNLKIDEYEALQQGKRWLYGLKSINDIQKSIASITSSQAFNKQLQSRQKAIQGEVNLRSSFVRAIELRDFAWWQTEVEKIKKPNSDKDIELVKQRILSYLSMVSYMLVKSDISAQKFESAFKKIQVYELVDPTNPDVYLMYAYYYSLKGDINQMQASYKKAQNLGFNDYAIYKTDDFWKKLLNAPEIIAMQ